MRAISYLLVIILIFSSVLSTQSAASNEEATNPWAPKSALPIAAAFIKTGVVNDEIYVFGSNFTYCYNLISWSPKKAMPTYRGDFAAATSENMVYCIGGRTNAGPSQANEAYNSASDSWEESVAMPTPRHGLDANVVNGKIYLISGLVPETRYPNVNVDLYTTFKLTNVTEVYDPKTDTWATKTPIPNGAAYYSSAVIDDKIYIFSESLTQIYDVETDTWSYGSPPPFSVDMAAAVAITDLSPKQVYVVGGRRSSLEAEYVQIYNPQNDSWSMGASMMTPRYALATCVLNNKIYAIGGLTGAFVSVTQKNSIEQYDPLKDSLIPVVHAGSPTPTMPPVTPPINTPEAEVFPVGVTALIVIVVVGLASLLIYYRKIRVSKNFKL